MNLLRIGIPAAILLLSNGFANVAMYNAIRQLMIFIICAHIPALVTGRMSYVDIAWPYGLFTIGLMPLLSSNGNFINFLHTATFICL